jgi:hypothetical protein
LGLISADTSNGKDTQDERLEYKTQLVPVLPKKRAKRQVKQLEAD